ncbi:MAG: PIG-L family deacetylase [Planctomycetes bacterium]|nr:PIG-L family deacetylase [Planctomycetota bacterium]
MLEWPKSKEESPIVSEQNRIMVIGAHPDDCEVKCAGTAAKWAAQGHAVCFMSVTNGQSGHHLMAPADLAVRRKKEAAAAAAVLGVESRVLTNADGHLEPSLAVRQGVIAEIRKFKPDLIITHRPNDYHPDHRYTSQVVQDAAFSVVVPHIVPEVPALDVNPVMAYMSDGFMKPYPFTPSVVVAIDDVYDQKLAAIHEHASQFYEWMPYIGKYDIPVPEGEAARREWLVEYEDKRDRDPAQRFRNMLIERYGEEQGQAVQCSEAYEACEYGSPLNEAAIQKLFKGL